MNLESRKIEFVQEFLKLQNEELLGKLENLLSKKKENIYSLETETFSKKELNNRIAQSEKDFAENKFKESSELLEKYSK